MIPELRESFNARFTPELYRNFLDRLGSVKFRLSETPCFFPPELIARMAGAGRELVTQLLANPGYIDAADQSIPPQFRVPRTNPEPLFVQADFGIAGGEPRLVEIQGFPSIYAFQLELAQSYCEAYGLPGHLRYLLGGLEPESYKQLLSRAVLGKHDPENVVLLEIDPWSQKTAVDFKLTERICGIKTIDVTDVYKEGNRLFYGNGIPIRRIYNRAIADELVRKEIPLDFDWREDLDVEWAGHPNWFFRISKFSLPYFRHWSVPQSWFLDRVAELPAAPENLVLKPLFSFAGTGVVVGPTKEQIDAIPASERGNYLLQERVHFEPVIRTPHGPTHAEVRIMYIWDGFLRPVNLIVRMGRGKMMGVDQNRDQEWVGASAGFTPRMVP